MVPESRIATCAFILMFWHKQSLAAAYTWVHTSVFVPPVRSSEWSLSARALSHIELLRSESALKFLFSLPCVLCNPSLKSFLIFELAGFPTAILGLEKVVGHRSILIYSHIVDLLLNWKYSLAQQDLLNGHLSHSLGRFRLFKVVKGLVSLLLLCLNPLLLLFLLNTLSCLLLLHLSLYFNVTLFFVLLPLCLCNFVRCTRDIRCLLSLLLLEKFVKDAILTTLRCKEQAHCVSIVDNGTCGQQMLIDQHFFLIINYSSLIY